MAALAKGYLGRALLNTKNRKYTKGSRKPPIPCKILLFFVFSVRFVVKNKKPINKKGTKSTKG